MSEDLMLIKRESVNKLADIARDNGHMKDILINYLTTDKRDNKFNFIIPNGTTVIRDYLFQNSYIESLILPEGLVSIGDRAFSDCLYLKEISFPHGLTSIGKYAFSYCKLKSVYLPSTLTNINVEAFANSHNLESVYINSNIICESAFARCTELVDVHISDNVTILSGTFPECTNLKTVYLPEGLTSIGERTFYRCTNLALTSLPEGLTSIESYAFSGCANLALTSLPVGLTSIGTHAFSNCTNLALTSLPEGLTNISNYTFRDCTGLTTLTLPSTITEIGKIAFSGCTNLTTINVPWAEGEVANAPWGATNATINYGYVG